MESDTEPSVADLPASAFVATAANSATPVFPAIPVRYLLDQNERLIARIKLCYGEDIASFEDDVLALIRAYAAYVHLLPASHTRSGVRVLSKIVPAVTVLWCEQLLHISRERLDRYGSPMAPQFGQTNPRGQRSRSKYPRQASSLPNQSRNSFQLRG